MVLMLKHLWETLWPLLISATLAVLSYEFFTRLLDDRKLARELQAQAARQKAELRTAILLLGTLMAEYTLTDPPHVVFSPEWWMGLQEFTAKNMGKDSSMVM
jgi:hypothetical protein